MSTSHGTMGTSTAYVLLANGYADWEAASALAELRRTFGFRTQTIGMDMNLITSMGGMNVLPDIALSKFTPESAAILILPGGEAWIHGEIDAVSEAVIAMIAAERPVAAICAATLALAHAGLLNDRLHTSNGRGFIDKHVPEYCGQKLYRSSHAITDHLVITANGLAPVAFAAEIFRMLVPERKRDIEMYTNLYARGAFD